MKKTPKELSSEYYQFVNSFTQFLLKILKNFSLCAKIKTQYILSFALYSEGKFNFYKGIVL